MDLAANYLLIDAFRTYAFKVIIDMLDKPAVSTSSQDITIGEIEALNKGGRLTCVDLALSSISF